MWKNGMKDGKGKYISKNLGVSYDGMFKNGNMHGEGFDTYLGK